MVWVGAVSGVAAFGSSLWSQGRTLLVKKRTLHPGHLFAQQAQLAQPLFHLVSSHFELARKLFNVQMVRSLQRLLNHRRRHEQLRSEQIGLVLQLVLLPLRGPADRLGAVHHVMPDLVGKPPALTRRRTHCLAAKAGTTTVLARQGVPHVGRQMPRPLVMQSQVRKDALKIDGNLLDRRGPQDVTRLLLEVARGFGRR